MPDAKVVNGRVFERFELPQKPGKALTLRFDGRVLHLSVGTYRALGEARHVHVMFKQSEGDEPLVLALVPIEKPDRYSYHLTRTSSSNVVLAAGALSKSFPLRKGTRYTAKPYENGLAFEVPA